MRTALLIAAGIGLLVTVPLVVAAILPSTYVVSRSTIIERPAADVSAFVADFGERTRWIPWSATEPNASYATVGVRGAIGSKFRWSGAEIGAGSVTLLAHRPGEAVETALIMERPMSMRARDSFSFETLSPTRTRITWTNTGTLPYPAGRFFGMVANRVIGADYVSGLARMRAVLETPAPLAASR